MTLPSSGQISMEDIYYEWNKSYPPLNSNVDLRDMSSKFDITSSPNGMDEFYNKTVTMPDIFDWSDPNGGKSLDGYDDNLGYQFSYKDSSCMATSYVYPTPYTWDASIYINWEHTCDSRNGTYGQSSNLVFEYRFKISGGPWSAWYTFSAPSGDQLPSSINAPPNWEEEEENSFVVALPMHTDRIYEFRYFHYWSSINGSPGEYEYPAFVMASVDITISGSRSYDSDLIVRRDIGGPHHTRFRFWTHNNFGSAVGYNGSWSFLYNF